MRIEIFTRWNAKAWPTMIAMEGSILNFFLSLVLSQVVSRWSAGGQVVFHQVAGGDQGDFWPVVGVARCRVVKVQHVMTTRWKCLVMILSDGW